MGRSEAEQDSSMKISRPVMRSFAPHNGSRSAAGAEPPPTLDGMTTPNTTAVPPSAAVGGYALVPELQPLGNLESSDIRWLEDLVHQIPVALLGKMVLNSDRIGIAILTRVTLFPHDTPSKLRL